MQIAKFILHGKCFFEHKITKYSSMKFSALWYDELTILADQLDIHWYLIVLVLGNCGRLKGLADKAVADQQEFTLYH